MPAPARRRGKPAAGLERQLETWGRKYDGLLVALDFDGTLARLRRDPENSSLPRQRRAQLRVLSRLPGVRVLIVSGRSLPDLRRLCRGTGAALAGDHGIHLEGFGQDWRHPDLKLWSRQAGTLAAAALEETMGLRGIRVERKEASVAVHYRLSPEFRADPLALRRRLLARLIPGWRLAPGKCLWEYRPAKAWGKGDAVLLALKRLGLGWRPMFIGDDATDEEGFSVLWRHAWTVWVGPGRTAAHWRVKGLPDVDRLLAAVRRGRR